MFTRLPAICTPAILAALSAGALVRAGEPETAEPPPVTLTAAVERLQELEATIARLESAVASTGTALAASNEEAARARNAEEQLRLTMEALGLAALKPEMKTVQERLVGALNDYRLAARDRDALAARLLSLSEAALTLVSDPSSEAARNLLQSEISSANRDIAAAEASSAPPPPVPLASAKVISVRRELGLAVVDAGRDSGLRMGTPVRFVREGDNEVASGVVVDLRSRISGILLTSSGATGTVTPGDGARVDTNQPLKQ